MAKVSTLKSAIHLCTKAGITPFIWGHRGMGKSSIVKQLAAENGMGFIDMRCSQMEASDLRGLPDREGGRTIFCPPAEMPVGDLTDETILERILAPFQGSGEHPLNFTTSDPKKQHERLVAALDEDLQAHRIYNARLKLLQPRFQKGIIFLDELNRAQDDVQQASFQFVLDREIGQYVLPPGWAIVAAGNFNEGYQTSGFTDMAFLDRFCHLMFSGGDTTLEDWIFYMSQQYGEKASAVIEFASQNIKHLDGDIQGELGFTIQPSRRSWDSVVRVQQAANQHGSPRDALHEVLAGLIGRELALAFSRYDCPVKPQAILAKGVKPVKSDLDGLSRGQLIGLFWGVVSCAKEKIGEDQIAEHCMQFAEWMVSRQGDKDLAVAFCRAMVTSGAGSTEKACAAVISNPRLAKAIAKFKNKQGGPKTFIDRLNERPKLQDIMSKVAWGSTEE
jgi:MoxR-like ATPase